MLENSVSTHVFSYVRETSRKPGKLVSPSTRNILSQVFQVLSSLQLFFFSFAYRYFLLTFVKQQTLSDHLHFCEDHLIPSKMRWIIPLFRFKHPKRKDVCCQPRKLVLVVPHKLTSSLPENLHLCLAWSSGNFEAQDMKSCLWLTVGFSDLKGFFSNLNSWFNYFRLL